MDDLTGKRFGLLEVLCFDTMVKHRTKWFCLCDCGRICSIIGRDLKHRTSVASCGCLWGSKIRLNYHGERYGNKTYIGNVYGSLEVLAESKNRDKNGNVLFECFCHACGKIVLKRSCQFNQWTKSCGCLQYKQNKHCADIGVYSLPKPIKTRFLTYINSAKQRGLNFNLSIDDFNFLITQNCAYCNKPYSAENYMGIDRVDSNRGYTVDNCVPCCITCNRMKLNYEYSFWISHIKKIISHHEIGIAEFEQKRLEYQKEAVNAAN